MICECADYFIAVLLFMKQYTGVVKQYKALMKQYNDLMKQNHRLLFHQLLATAVYQ